MNAEMKYGDVALGVEAALPVLPATQRRSRGYARLVCTRLVCTLMHRTLIRLYAALMRRA